MSHHGSSMRILVAVVGAVTVWCGVHAFGLWQHDVRRSIVLFMCVAFFFVLWAFAFAFRGATASSLADSSSELRWNKACILGFILALSGFILAGLRLLLIHTPTQRMLLLTASWSAVVAIAISLISTAIGLSDPHARRGKTLGLAVFVLVGGFVAMSIVIR